MCDNAGSSTTYRRSSVMHCRAAVLVTLSHVCSSLQELFRIPIVPGCTSFQEDFVVVLLPLERVQAVGKHLQLIRHELLLGQGGDALDRKLVHDEQRGTLVQRNAARSFVCLLFQSIPDLVEWTGRALVVIWQKNPRKCCNSGSLSHYFSN